MADEQDGAERTEEATPQKRERARKEGQVAVSQEAGVAATMLVLTAVVLWILPSRVDHALALFHRGLRLEGFEELSSVTAAVVLSQAGRSVLGLVGPVALLALFAGTFVSVVQVGFHLNPEALGPKWERLDPSKWFGKLTSVELPVTVAKSLFKGLGIVAIALLSLEDEPSRLWRLAFATPAELGGHLSELAFGVASRVAAALVLLALFDVAWTRYRFEEKLKMSKQELKDEAKQTDGNPHVKGAMRRKMREMSQKGLAERLKEATVVAVNPTHYAVALRYWQAKDAAPVVIAKGVDHRAARIRELAEKYQIPIIEDPPTARALYAAAREGKPVPAELYKAVARLLAIVYRRRGAEGARRVTDGRVDR